MQMNWFKIFWTFKFILRLFLKKTAAKRLLINQNDGQGREKKEK